MVRYIIALSELGVKNENLIELLRNHSSDIVDMFEQSDKDIFEKYLDLMLFSELFSDKEKIRRGLENADEILLKNKELNIKTTYYTASTYPKELSVIDNPPAILYYMGAEFSDVSSKAIACVGSRNPTRLSYNAINYLVPQWIKEDCSIISGLACGVDKLSHQACISAGGKTVAVLAHGLDTIYPKENISLAERIVESGGIIMSEYPVGVKADRFRFVKRNRLIVGLSKVVVIYECDVMGGTMHNAEYAMNQNKPIFCIDVGEKVMEVQTGTKKLINDKVAEVIRDGRDIFGVLEAVGSQEFKKRMSAMEVKHNYLHSMLLCMNNSDVLKTTLRDLDINIDSQKSAYNSFIELVNDNLLNIDELLKVLVDNNIASINKMLAIEE